jgi:hypothetical protein
VDDELCSIKSTNFDFAESITDEMIMKNKRRIGGDIKKLESQRIDELEAKIEAKLIKYRRTTIG